MTSPNPVAIIESICLSIKADTFSFYYGRKFDQNFGRDDAGNEFTGNVIFLDPFVMKAKQNKTNIDEYNVPIALTFGYFSKADELALTQAEKIAYQSRAIAAAREFYYKLNVYDRAVIKETLEKTLTPFESLFDLNLCGVLLETSFTLLDASGVCYP